MSRQRKSRAGGHTSTAATVTRDSVRHNHSTASRGQNATSATAVIWHNGRVIGEVTPGGEFQKRVRGSVHFLRSPRAIAWDVDALHQAEREGATSVLIVDTETGREFRAPLATVWAKGFRVSRGYGEQWALRLDIFNRPEEPAQLSLFGGKA